MESRSVLAVPYLLTLAADLEVYDAGVIGLPGENTLHSLQIPSDGFVLEPNRVYVGRTSEAAFVGTDDIQEANLVPGLVIRRIGPKLVDERVSFEFHVVQAVRVTPGLPLFSVAALHSYLDSYSLAEIHPPAVGASGVLSPTSLVVDDPVDYATVETGAHTDLSTGQMIEETEQIVATAHLRDATEIIADMSLSTDRMANRIEQLIEKYSAAIAEPST